MAKRDYYEVLGLSRGASEQDIKSAFRRLAKDCHPDRNHGDTDAERKFKELNEAYEALKDPQKRAAYDQFGHAAFDGQGRGGQRLRAATSPRRCRTSSTTCSASSWAAGAAAASARAASAAPTCATTWRSPSTEAYAGQDRADPRADQRHLRGLHRLGRQDRHPARPPAPPAAAPARCAQARASSPSSAPARPARGAARSSTIRAARARAPAGSSRSATLSVNIPAGVEDGTRIRLAGEGEAGLRGGPAGDLYIFLSLKPHEFFQRDGADIFCRVPISMTTAALGGQIDVPTVDGGKTRVKVPEGTETGKQFRLKSKGMPVLRSQGDGRHVHPGRRRDTFRPDFH